MEVEKRRKRNRINGCVLDVHPPAIVLSNTLMARAGNTSWHAPLDSYDKQRLQTILGMSNTPPSVSNGC